MSTMLHTFAICLNLRYTFEQLTLQLDHIRLYVKVYTFLTKHCHVG